MNRIIDISDWNQLRSYHTGGTRNKMYLQSPKLENYFFKESQKKGIKDYKVEFWSEIIAFELGVMFGFNVLRYDVAIFHDKIGCLSKSMIQPDKEEMVELGKYLQTFDREFEYQEKKPGKSYNFELIENALEALGLQRFIPNIIQTIVFDAVIGNGDRHQENLALICPFGVRSEIAEVSKQILDEPSPFYKRLLKLLSPEERKDASNLLDRWKLQSNKKAAYSPIYDNGSSLGRELAESVIENLMNDKQKFQKYVQNGKSEIHWNEKKLSHIELVKNIRDRYPDKTNAAIVQIIRNYKRNELNSILKNIDNEIPEKFASYRLTLQRKQFIEMLVSERVQKLSELVK